MLILGRRVGETLHIGDDVVVTIQRIEGGRVTVGVSAPPEVTILRGELAERLAHEKPEGTPA